MDGKIDFYRSQVVSATDYYCFGSPMQGRSFQPVVPYKYGFNGQEKDDEIYGNGNSYTAEFWQYDPRLGRRWNLEPEMRKYAGWSPYSTFTDNPIFNNDPNGADPDPEDKNTNVVTDAGHGGDDSGAPKQEGKRNEADITLKVVTNINNRLAELNKLNQQQVNVSSTRTTNVNPGGSGQKASLDARVAAGKQANADLFVSIHVNSGSNKTADYLTVFTKVGANEVSKTLSKNIAEAMNGVATTQMGVREDQANHQVTKQANLSAGAVLVEIGFITNPEQEKLFNDDSYLLKLGNSIGDAIYKTAYPDASPLLVTPAYHSEYIWAH